MKADTYSVLNNTVVRALNLDALVVLQVEIWFADAALDVNGKYGICRAFWDSNTLAVDFIVIGWTGTAQT